MTPEDHDRFVLVLGGREETADTHSSTPLLGLLGGDESICVLTKGGVLGDRGDSVRLSLGGEPRPEPGPGTGYLEKSLPSIGCALLRSASKLIRGLVTRVGEPRDFRWTAFDRVGLLGGSADIGGEGNLRNDCCGGLDGGLACSRTVS